MPRTSHRRDLLTDTALRLIDEIGLDEVTHRAIDAAAEVPPGTTSNYFRTRAALYEAIARRLLDHQLTDLAALPAVTTHEELVTALAATVEAGDGPARNRYLARIELSVAAARNPALAALMRDLRAATLRVLGHQIRAVYPKATDRQLHTLGSVLTGITLDRIALAVPGMDVREALSALTRGLLEK
ncbi:TetR family transcriptional regulator [Nonomuraea angiospora]|uniref:TetR/AcrR family transcriptional regulator n=1 Tax=Nonomuraea angiospora TaxID=46172 RepID=UPI0033D1EEC6